jgi:regulator of sigma E protease
MQEIWTLAGMALLAFLAMVTVIAFVHELGHYLAARACGVAVQVFSIGFGRTLVSWTDRNGTLWRLGLLPLGGYIKMVGEVEESGRGQPGLTPAERRVCFYHRPLAQRAAIVLAGPAANLVFAFVAIVLLALAIGRIVQSPQILSVAAESPAAVAGFLPGDRIVAVAGAPVESFSEFKAHASAGGAGPLAVDVLRQGQRERLALGADDGRWDGAFGLESRGRESVAIGLGGAADYALGVTGRFAYATLSALHDLLGGGPAAAALAGPVRVAQFSGEMTLAFGLGALVLLAALLSVNVAVFNLLPVPALDGGHLVFLGIEKLRGRPLPRRVQQISSLGGFGLVILLCVVMTANDLVNLLG